MAAPKRKESRREILTSEKTLGPLELLMGLEPTTFSFFRMSRSTIEP